MTFKIKPHPCWKLKEKTKKVISFQTKDGRETRTIYKLGNSWVETGGHDLPEIKYNSSFAPTFVSRKKDALRYLESATSRCPHTSKEKGGLIVTRYTD